MYYVKIETKNGLTMSYMQAKCKESEVNALRMQTLKPTFHGVRMQSYMKCLMWPN